MSLAKRVKPNDDQNQVSSGVSWNGWNNGKMIDDCVGLTLSYISLEDKFRLESVSKQWKRNIFWSVGYLSIEGHESGKGLCLVGDMNSTISSPVNADDLKIIFKKCQQIEFIEVKKPFYNLSNDLLSVIANQCEFLSHLKIHFYDLATQIHQPLMDFFLKCGPKLKILEINGRIGAEYYSMCANLEEIAILSDVSLVSLVNLKACFPKIISIEGCIYSSEIISPEFDLFCNEYGSQLKRIKLRIIGNLEKHELMHLFYLIDTKFVRLNYISISMESLRQPMGEIFTTNELDELKKMSVWIKLKELKMNIEYYRHTSSFTCYYQSFVRPFLYASHFNLESLQLLPHIKMFNLNRLKGSISGDNLVLPKLKTLIICYRTPDGFYNDFHIRFPNLTKLVITDEIKKLSGYNIFKDLAMMTHLKSLEVMCYASGIKSFITKYSTSMIGHESLRFIEYNQFSSDRKVSMFVSLKDIQAIIHFALTIPSVKMRFFHSTYVLFYHSEFNQKKASIKQIRCKLSRLSIPKNLTIYIEKKLVIMNGRII